MNWLKSNIQILGLSTLEKEILQTLILPQSYSSAARLMPIPRTTIAYITRSLISRGLVSPIRHGKRFLYVSISNEKLAGKLNQTAYSLGHGLQDRHGVKIHLSRESNFIVHLGIKEVIPAYERIALNNKNERIRAIQGNKSWDTLAEKLKPEQLIRFNRAIIDNKLIIDGILQENSYKKYAQSIEKDKKKRQGVESLGGRMADYTFVADTFFDTYCEIWIFKTTSILINWMEEIAVEIINPDMTNFLRDMFEFVKIGGRKVDHNQAVQQVIRNMKPLE